MSPPILFFRGQQAPVVANVARDNFNAIEPNAADGDPGQTGIFYLQFNQRISQDVTLYYQIGGAASNGVDYTYLNGVATIPANQWDAEIDVQPIEDDVLEPDETVTLTLLPGTNYLIDPNGISATLLIKDWGTTMSAYGNAEAIEPGGPPGAPAQTNYFLIYRTDEPRRSPFSPELTVHYQLGGAASNGVDYVGDDGQPLSGEVTFAENVTRTNLDIVPLADNLAEGIESVTLTLLPTNGYAVDTNNTSGTNTIADSSTTVSISPQNDATEPGGTDPGVTGLCYVTRTDSRGYSFDLPVRYVISGTASNGVDYTNLSGTVIIPANEPSADIYVQPLADNLLEGDETVILTLFTTNGNYLITSDPMYAAVTVIIHDHPPTNAFTVVTNLSNEPVGIDYDPVLTNLIVSIANGDPDFSNDDFVRLGANGAGALTLTNWSDIQGLSDEVKVATVKTNANGFVQGDTYFGSGTSIGWLSADGTVSNLNWCILTNDVVINTMPIRGSLYVDQTGIFSNDLVAVTSDSLYSLNDKGVWLINSSGQPRLLASILTKHLEGVITLPNDTNQWGPWAGKILTGDEAENILYTIDTNGVVASYDTTSLISGGIGSEDFDLIPTNQDLYCCDENSLQILKVSRASLTNYVGSLLIDQSGDGAQNVTPTLFIVKWDNSATNFVIRNIPHNDEFEHVTFAPVDLPSSPQ